MPVAVHQIGVLDTLQHHLSETVEKCVTCPPPYPLSSFFPSVHGRRQLLYETDHEALRESCQEVIQNQGIYQLDPWGIHPGDPNLPPLLRQLQPQYIKVTENEVWLAFDAWYRGYGIVLFLNKGEVPPEGIRLLDELWYYDTQLTQYRYWIQRLMSLKPSEMNDPPWWPKTREQHQYWPPCPLCNVVNFCYHWDAVLGFYLLSFVLAQDNIIIETFDCKQDRSIVLSSDSFCDPICFVKYQVFVGQEEVVPHTSIHGLEASKKRSYTLVTSQSGQIVAVVTKEIPYEPLIIHDFETGQTWPREEDSYASLRLRLNEENSKMSAFAKLQDRNYLATTKSLELGYSPITDADLEPLQEFTNIQSLSLAYTQITDEGMKFVAHMPNLNALDLEKTAITDRGIQYLLQLPNLRHLNLKQTSLHDEGLKTLQALHTLEWLYLDETSVTDEGLKSIVSMPNLIYVSLTHTAITNAGLAIFQEAPQDYRVIIDVTETHVTCDYLKELRQVLPKIDFRQQSCRYSSSTSSVDQE